MFNELFIGRNSVELDCKESVVWMANLSWGPVCNRNDPVSWNVVLPQVPKVMASYVKIHDLSFLLQMASKKEERKRGIEGSK